MADIMVSIVFQEHTKRQSNQRSPERLCCAVLWQAAGLTAGVYDKWTGTQTGASNTTAASNNTDVLANSGKVAVEGGLSTWSGVGQFATNQALQNGTSAVLNKALGQDGSFGDAL